METLWSDDLVVTNPLNQFVNKQHVLDMVSTATLAFSSYDRQIEYLHFYGDIAIVAGGETVVWAGKMPLAGKTSHLRYTAVWRRQNGTWQEVVRHANIIPPQRLHPELLRFVEFGVGDFTECVLRTTAASASIYLFSTRRPWRQKGSVACESLGGHRRCWTFYWV
jgi:hypothetical protein